MNPEYNAFGYGEPGAASGGGGGWTQIFSDPNFLNFLAGTGARMDPEGAGGAIGGATQDMIQQQQMGKAMEKQGDMMDRLLEALAGGRVRSASIKPDGGMTLTGHEHSDEAVSKRQQDEASQKPAIDVLDNMMQESRKRMEAFRQRFGH